MLPLFDNLPHKRTPVVTALLLAANLAIFGYEVWLMAMGGGALERFLLQHALVPARLIDGWADWRQWATVFSSMFLHGGIAHVLGNCWFLWVFGNNVEDRMGHAGYLAFYLFAGVCAAALQVLVAPGSDVPMIGASGAISGVLGAYLILHPFAWVFTLVPWIVPIVPVPAFLFLVLWFFVQAGNGLGALLGGTVADGGVAWWAHAGGFIAGVLVLRWARQERLVRGGRR